MDRILNTLLLGTAIVAMALSAAADYVREDELTVRTAVQGWSASQQTIDLRKAFTVSSLEDEALRGLMYSANGWERDAAGDASRTVAITAQAGTLANGVFTPDGSAEMTVATGLGGEGTVDWALTEISKKVYRLKHAVRKDGAPVGVADLYGYLDFTHCLSWASQSDVEAAVLGEFTHGIAVTQDADSPWQPIDSTVVRSGLMTDGEWLEPGDVTVTAFAFGGRGVLHYEYDLTGGGCRRQDCHDLYRAEVGLCAVSGVV